MNYMFCNLSTPNYDSILNSWSQQSVQNNVIFDGGYSVYSNIGEVGRNILINNFSWIITDGGELPEACNESWIQNNTECNGTDYIIQYYDENNCTTYDDLPILNGTVVDCRASSGLIIKNVDTQPIIAVLIALVVIALICGVLFGFLGDKFETENMEKYTYGIIALAIILLIIIFILAVT